MVAVVNEAAATGWGPIIDHPPQGIENEQS
jgi:hypothetical protein